MTDYKLCYVSTPWAWFTTAPLDQQWGDDWNDAPYEHNAGRPYEWKPYRDMPPYSLKQLAFDGPLEAPGDYPLNSAYSVQDINGGAVPWLQTDRYCVGPTQGLIKIWAGTTVEEFIALVVSNGGRIFLELDTAPDVDDLRQLLKERPDSAIVRDAIGEDV